MMASSKRVDHAFKVNEAGFKHTIPLSPVGRTEWANGSHVLASLRGEGRLPYRNGHLEVLRVDRILLPSREPITPHPNGIQVSSQILLEGVPANHGSSLRRARLAFVDAKFELPRTRAEVDRGLLLAYYPLHDLQPVLDILSSGKRLNCYFWRSADSTNTWLMLIALG